MSTTIDGIENSIAVRLVWVDTKEVLYFKSIASASRYANKPAKSIREGLDPMKRMKFDIGGRLAVFRVHVADKKPNTVYVENEEKKIEVQKKPKKK